MNNEDVNLTNDAYSIHRILKTDIKKDPNVEEDEIIFGCGCFWGAETVSYTHLTLPTNREV